MSLQLYNRSAMLTHLSSAIGFGTYFLLSNTSTPLGVDLSIREHKLTVTDTLGNPSYSYTSEQTGIVTLKQIQALLISFFLITAGFHAYYYLADGSISHQYSEMIKSKNNYLRWIEYSISATIMLYIIAYISGTKDRNIYYLITATNVAMMAQGQWIEEAVRDKKQWCVPMCTAFLLLLTEFYVIYRDFKRRSMVENENGFKIKVTLSTSLLVMFLFFLMFGFIALYGVLSGQEYYYIEVMYIFASLIAKNWLARYLAVFVIN